MSFFSRRKSQSSPGLPVLPDAVDDNVYLAAASKAGELDKSSGAYDHFLFEDKSMTAMPFEQAVDAHMSLVSLRLEDLGRRELLNVQKQTLAGKAEVEVSQIRLDRISQNLENMQGKLLEQERILNEERPGRHGLMWPGTIPELTTKINGYSKVFSPYLVFLLVGLVDVLIVYYSLNNIPGFNNWEPIFFAAPVIGVQLVFPHLIGQRLALLSHGTLEKVRNKLEAAILFVVWITFAVALTQIRMLYIEKLAFEDNEPLNDILFAILWITNFLMLVGLGSWLLLLESRRNHHEHAALRIKIRMEKLRDQRNSALETLERAKSRIPSLELAESVASASYEDAVHRAGSSLAEAAKAVYRRSLVNQVGTAEFTAAYLSSESMKKGKGQ